MNTKKGIKMVDMLNTNYSIKAAMNALHIDFFDLIHIYWDELKDHIIIERIEKKHYLDKSKRMLMASGGIGFVNYFYTIPVDDFLDLGVYKMNYGYKGFQEDTFVNDGKKIYWITDSEVLEKWFEIEKIFLMNRRDLRIEKIIGNDEII